MGTAIDLSFAHVCAYTPYINVWSQEDEVVTIFRPEKPPHNFGFYRVQKGTGTTNDPYAYLTRLDEDVYYEIIELWLYYKSAIPVFIKAGDWLLRAEPQGVRANTRVFTRLLPPE